MNPPADHPEPVFQVIGGYSPSDALLELLADLLLEVVAIEEAESGDPSIAVINSGDE